MHRDQRLSLVKSKYRNIVSKLNQSAMVGACANPTRTKSTSQRGAASARAETPQLRFDGLNRAAPNSSRAHRVAGSDSRSKSRQQSAKPSQLRNKQGSENRVTEASNLPHKTKKVLQQIQCEQRAVGLGTERKKANQSAIIRQISPRSFLGKKCVSRKVSPSGARKSPQPFSGRKRSTSRNMLSEQIENICQVLECINQQKPSSKSNEEINRMLRDLLKSELTKLGKTRVSGLSKERKNSVAQPSSRVEVRVEEGNHEEEEDSSRPRAVSKDPRARHRTPSAERKPAINVSINHNVGNVCYVPVFIGGGNSRSSSKETPSAGGHSSLESSAQHIKIGTNAIGSRRNSIGLCHDRGVGRDSGRQGEDVPSVQIKMYDAISGEREKLISYTKHCIQSHARHVDRH